MAWNPSVDSEESLQDNLVWDIFFLFADVMYLHWMISELSLQPHLPSISDNINEVEFHQKDYDCMLAVMSREGEKIPVILWIFFPEMLLIDNSFYYWT